MNLARLHLDPDETRLVADGDETARLALGYRTIAARCFRGDGPTGPELERAIELVEDEIMRAGALPGARGELVSSDALVCDLARSAGHEPAGPWALALATVESMFQQLASAALGDPTAARGLPHGAEAAAALLILRELMHHAPYTAIVGTGV